MPRPWRPSWFTPQVEAHGVHVALHGGGINYDAALHCSAVLGLVDAWNEVIDFALFDQSKLDPPNYGPPVGVTLPPKPFARIRASLAVSRGEVRLLTDYAADDCEAVVGSFGLYGVVSTKERLAVTGSAHLGESSGGIGGRGLGDSRSDDRRGTALWTRATIVANSIELFQSSPAMGYRKDKAFIRPFEVEVSVVDVPSSLTSSPGSRPRRSRGEGTPRSPGAAFGGGSPDMGESDWVTSISNFEGASSASAVNIYGEFLLAW